MNVMQYTITHTDSNLQSTVSQRCPTDGKLYHLRTMHRSAAAKFCNEANERLRRTYQDNGITVIYPCETG